MEAVSRPIFTLSVPKSRIRILMVRMFLTTRFARHEDVDSFGGHRPDGVGGVAYAIELHRMALWQVVRACVADYRLTGAPSLALRSILRR